MDNIIKMFKKSFFLVFCLCLTILATIKAEEAVWHSGNLAKREQRTTLASAEYGEISAVRVSDNVNGSSYLLHFFTLEPNSLFLPVVLHADMVFYVHTGSGKLSWTEEDDLESTELLRGDVYALQQGSVFFIQSNLETAGTERQKLRIYAIFANSKYGLEGPTTGPYSSIREMVLGFDRKVLQAAFKVSEEVIDELLGGTRPPAIIHAVQETKRKAWEMETQFVRNLLRSRSYDIFELNKNKKRTGAKSYNLFKEDKDFENCNGWSTTVTRKKLSALKGTNFGVFMVNLTIGSMMGPHWNPRATEIAVVLQGRGMVRTVCSSISNETTCKNMRFEVKEGDVFLVPRFHPMAQMAFNNETFVFMGFSTSIKKNRPQFLAGQASVLRTLKKDVLAMSFNATNTTLDELLGAQHDSVILGCTSCAEEELRIMEEEIEREREEERQQEEEEARQREEERRREEEEARKREEEEARREEEEKRRREEEEEKRRQEEEEKRREEEAAARREEEERRRQEEEASRREEEEARRREEEAARREEEEEEEGQREQEEEEARHQEQEEEEEARHREQEEARRRREEEQAAEAERRREEETQREAEAARQQERERERRQEEAQKREQEEEEAQQREEEARRREQEEEEARQRQQQEEEEEARRRRQGRQEEEEGSRRREKEAAAEQERTREEAARREEEAAGQQERERQRRQQEEEEGGGDEEAEEEGWLLVSKRLAL